LERFCEDVQERIKGVNKTEGEVEEVIGKIVDGIAVFCDIGIKGVEKLVCHCA